MVTVSLREMAFSWSSPSSTVIMLPNPSLKLPVLLQQSHTTSGYRMAPAVECFQAPCFLLLFLLGTLHHLHSLPHPPVFSCQNPFFKPISSAISTNYLLLWLSFLLIPLKVWNSSRPSPFPLDTPRLSHTSP